MTEPRKRRPPTRKIHQVIADVIGDIEAVALDGLNDSRGYRFRKLDDVVRSCREAMTKHSLIVLPEVISTEHATRERVRDGQPMGVTTEVRIIMRYKFIGPAGDFVECSTIGQAADIYDKGAAKAMSQAFKYAFLQVFQLQGGDDSDQESPEMGVLTVREGPRAPSNIERELMSAGWRGSPDELAIAHELVCGLRDQARKVMAEEIGDWRRVQRLAMRLDSNGRHWPYSPARADELASLLQSIHEPVQATQAQATTPVEIASKATHWGVVGTVNARALMARIEMAEPTLKGELIAELDAAHHLIDGPGGFTISPNMSTALYSSMIERLR